MDQKQQVKLWMENKPHYHEFLVDNEGNIVTLRGSHNQTAMKILKETNPQRYEEINKWWDKNIYETVYHRVLEKIEMIAVHGIKDNGELIVQGIPNETQEKFLKYYKRKVKEHGA